MPTELKLMAILAHPDDETLGIGGLLAKYAHDGACTYILTATRGERGWNGPEAENPGLTVLGQRRTAELQAAANILGVHEVRFMDYIDGDLDQADPAEAVGKIVAYLRAVRPQVVVTFDPFGAYGHPDHIAICQFTQAALVAAADPTYGEGPAYRVPKLYYFVDRKALIQGLAEAGAEIAMEIDGVVRRSVPWDDWAITTWIDTAAYWDQINAAVLCHQSQLPSIQDLLDLPLDVQKPFWAVQTLYRALSFVNGGRRIETDIFEGIRQ
jgi:LmbE family N-acetylglucosaminyl deacetylase